jgi:hypothetical protein
VPSAARLEVERRSGRERLRASRAHKAGRGDRHRVCSCLFLAGQGLHCRLLLRLCRLCISLSYGPIQISLEVICRVRIGLTFSLERAALKSVGISAVLLIRLLSNNKRKFPCVIHSSPLASTPSDMLALQAIKLPSTNDVGFRFTTQA